LFDGSILRRTVRQAIGSDRSGRGAFRAILDFNRGGSGSINRTPAAEGNAPWHVDGPGLARSDNPAGCRQGNECDEGGALARSIDVERQEIPYEATVKAERRHANAKFWTHLTRQPVIVWTSSSVMAEQPAPALEARSFSTRPRTRSAPLAARRSR